MSDMIQPPLSSPPPMIPEIYDFMMKIDPLKNDMLLLWEDLLLFKIGLWESFRRKNLRAYQTRYEKLTSEWIIARRKVTRMDDLIGKDDKDAESKLHIILTGGYLPHMQEHEKELSRIAHDATDILKDRITEADFKLTLIFHVLLL